MNVKFRIRLAAVAGAAALGLSLLAAPASADPINSGTGAAEFRQLVAVGSDTTQDVISRLGEVVLDPNNTPDNQLIASYGTTGTTPIKTRAVNCSIQRPNSSSAGIEALRADLSALPGSTTKNCIDVARSSRGPVDTSTTRLTWIPFAKDAVTVALRSDSLLNDGVGFTTAQLAQIYTCVPSALTRTYSTATGPVTITLKPLLPQAGSGTRTFFLEKIGVTTPGSCVDGTVQVNDGTVLTDPGHLAPYSITQYIAQTSGVVPDRHGVTVLSRVNGVAPRVAGKLNTAFPYARDVYNVVPTARLTDGAIPDADLISAFVGPTSKVCLQTTMIQAYAFATIANCGSTSLQGER
ncbi:MULTISPECIES: hypothetical protein [unclassified Streptomyces]|uniref:hypothetical protein n=1 Tax=unclassified Streptomyces TaxID=2593676 RepID=UPI00081D75F7|nr:MULTISPECIES: hypothetical protein [unclassified Streptomyces]MYZ33704.1 hypothetical protein [Streptomyces sp. SID4917]SCF61161.1 hypothetical protein GA0115259_100144 [Streptomyces sp. MnatMP-M17]